MDDVGADYYYDRQSTPDGRLGQWIYRKVLAPRRGYRNDQIGIPNDDPVWSDIFADIGRAAREGLLISDHN